MLTAVNEQQSKTVSIAFISLKTSLFGMIAIQTALDFSQSVNNPQTCKLDASEYFKIIRVLFVFSLVADTFALGYFYFSKVFKKAMFYVFYIYHWISTTICIAVVIPQLTSFYHCSPSYSLMYIIIAINLIFQVNALIVMVGAFYAVLKYIHFGSNLIWIVLWYTINMEGCNQISAQTVGILHVLLVIINLFTLITGKIFGSDSFLAKKWKFLTLLSILTLILCYLIILLGQQQVIKCASLKYFISCYTKFGLFQLIPPILLLLFLRISNKDPREQLIKRNERKQKQHSQLNKMFRMSQRL